MTQKSRSSLQKLKREWVRKHIVPCRQQITTERSTLVLKRFNVGLTEAETRRLNHLDWKLDAIDDALNGEHLDKLEVIVQMHEQAAKSITKAKRKYLPATKSDRT